MNQTEAREILFRDFGQIADKNILVLYTEGEKRAYITGQWGHVAYQNVGKHLFNLEYDDIDLVGQVDKRLLARYEFLLQQEICCVPLTLKNVQAILDEVYFEYADYDDKNVDVEEINLNLARLLLGHKYSIKTIEAGMYQDATYTKIRSIFSAWCQMCAQHSDILSDDNDDSYVEFFAKKIFECFN